MTVYGLKERHLQAEPNSHFFDYDTLKFFGERMSEMRVMKNTEQIKDARGEMHTCYVLSTLERNHPAGPRRMYHYFDTMTYKQVIV